MLLVFIHLYWQKKIVRYFRLEKKITTEKENFEIVKSYQDIYMIVRHAASAGQDRLVCILQKPRKVPFFTHL